VTGARDGQRDRAESPEETEALGAYRSARDAAFLGRPWDAAGADAWVSTYDLDLT